MKWLKFLNHLSSMDYCISLSDSNKNLDPGQITQFIDGGLDGLNSTNEVSITVSASVHLITELQKSSDGMVAAYGDIEVGNWASLLDIDHPLKSVRMTFGIPHDLVSDQNACVILTVPPSFLPLSTRSGVCVPTFLNKSITHVGTLHAVNSKQSSVCEIGSQLKFKFKSEEEFYLSKTEKRNIYLRLINASYLLLGVAFVMICFSLFRIGSYTSVVTNDRMPMSL